MLRAVVIAMVVMLGAAQGGCSKCDVNIVGSSGWQLPFACSASPPTPR
jgi:hypothetical protein